MTEDKGVVPVNRLLASVSDKNGLLRLMDFFDNRGVEIISTGGTAKMLRDAKLTVKDVSDLTGFPECLDGRLKTLHPMVHGGLLYRRSDPDHVLTAEELGIKPIDLLVVNLYPFEATIAKVGTTWETAVENIDIGGPAMIRAAAKNHPDVAVVTSPDQYDDVVREVSVHGGTTLRFRRKLMQAAFLNCALYDLAIAVYVLGQNEKKYG